MDDTKKQRELAEMRAVPPPAQVPLPFSSVETWAPEKMADKKAAMKASLDYYLQWKADQAKKPPEAVNSQAARNGRTG